MPSSILAAPRGTILPETDDGRIAVVGTPRSGTTILGSLLATVPGVEVLTEPFNPINGISAAIPRLPFADRGDASARAAIDAFLAGEAGDFRIRHLAHRIGRQLKPRSNPRTYRRIGRRAPRSLIVKDPFLSLSAGHLAQAHGFRIVWMIRHPAAVLASYMRVGWDADRVLADWCDAGVIDRATRDSAATLADRVGVLWQVVNAHLATTCRAMPERVLAVRHEDFCRDPHASLARIADAMRLPVRAATRVATERAMGGRTITPRFGRIHALRRDAASLPDAWRGLLTPADDITLRLRCGDLYRQLYDAGW